MAIGHRTRRRWTSKPGPGYRLDPSHPLVDGRNLLGAWVFNEEGGAWAFDLLLGQRIRLVGADASHPAWGPAGAGLGPKFMQNSQYGYTSDSSGTAANVPVPAAFSVAAGVIPSVSPQSAFARIAETDYQSRWFLGADTTGTHWQFIVNATGTGGFGTAISGTIQAGVGASLIATHQPTTGGNATGTLYVDRLAGVSYTPKASSTTPLPLYLGTEAGAPGGGFGLQGAYKYLYYYGSVLTAADAQWLNDEHYAFVLPPGGRRRSVTAAAPAAAKVPWHLLNRRAV